MIFPDSDRKDTEKKMQKRDKWHAAKKLQALNSVSYSFGWRLSWNFRKSQRVRTSLFIGRFWPESLVHVEQAEISPLCLLCPRVPTALLKAQQQCIAAAVLSGGVQSPSRSWIRSTQLTLPLSCPGVFFPHCPISSGLGLCSFLEHLPSCYSDDDNNGYHLLSTYLCQTPC